MPPAVVSAPRPPRSHPVASRQLRGAAIAAAALGLFGLPASPVLAGGLSVDLDQWASLDRTWQNGDLNGNNSRYPEGGVVPFRLAVEGLAKGDHSIVISYDFTASGHKAYDFLATWDAFARPPICGSGGGGRSSMCPDLPAAASALFPSDAYRADGLTVSGAEAYSAAPRRLTIWGGTIRSISGPSHTGSTSGNSSATFTVRFRSTGAAVLLAWGGHLAQSRYWDTAAGRPRDGASLVSGAPWHVRTLNLDGGGARNQDRSIQPSAVVGELPPFALAPSPPPTPRPPAAPRTPPPGGGGGAPSPDAPSRTGHVPTVPPTSTVPGGSSPEVSLLASAFVLTALLVSSALTIAVTRRPKRRRR